jgi:outer membrane lipoprotein-sorting protein
MKFIWFCVALLLPVLNLQAQDAATLVNKVKAKLDRVNDYQAEGKMKIDVSFIDAPESKVTIYYKKPDKFKVKKNGGISILPRGGVSINLSTLLSGSSYEVVPAKDAEVDGTATRVVKLLPSEENSDIVLTTLYIEEKSSVIRKATVTTRESGTYEINLTYGKFTDWGLPDKVIFSFNTKDYKLPKGITFEYEKGGKKKTEELKDKKGKVEITYSAYSINKGIPDQVFKEGN